MTDTYRIVGLAGRGAVAASDGQTQSHEPFLADLVLRAEQEVDLAAVATASAQALARPHTSLLGRAEGVAQAVRDAVDVVSVEVTVHRPEVSLGVPVLDVELTIVRPRAPSGEAPGSAAGSASAPAQHGSADAAVFADVARVPALDDGGAGTDPAQQAQPAGPGETGRPVEPVLPTSGRAGGPFDDVLAGRVTPGPVMPGTLAGITAGALAAGGLGAAAVSGASPVGVASAGAGGDAPDVDPNGTTVRTPHPAAAEAVARGDLEAEGDRGAESQSEAESGRERGVDTEPPVAEESSDHELESKVGAASDDAEPDPGVRVDDVSPAGVAVLGAPPVLGSVSDPGPGSDSDSDVNEPSESHGERDGGGSDEEDLTVAALPPTAMQPRRPSADSPLPTLVVLSARGASAQIELAGAVRAIGTAAGLEVTGVSPLARTTTGGGDLHTAVVAARTTLGPGELAGVLGGVSASRATVEAEILVVGDLVGTYDDVELPLPGVAASATVLVPWAHLDPQAILPGLGGGPVVVLAETAPDRESVRWLALDWLE